MPLLPSLGETKDTQEWGTAESITYATITYAVAMAFAAGIIIAVINFTRFVKGERGSPIRHPMFLFYLWAVLDFAANVTWLVLAITANGDRLVFVTFLPATFKALLGLEQIWLMVELIEQINIAKLILTASILQGGEATT